MSKRKNPLLAAIFSLIIAGMGQLYIRKFKRSLFFFLLEIITAGIYFFIDPNSGGILNISVSILAAYDAYKIAKSIPIETKLESEGIENRPEIYIR